MHLQCISQKYPEDSFLAGCHRVVEGEGKEIEVELDAAVWTKVTDGQWEILPAQPIVCTIKTLIHSLKYLLFCIGDQSCA